MKYERDYFRDRESLLAVHDSVIIDKQYTDSFGNHLNQAKSLILFEEQRLRALEECGLSRDVLLKTYHALPFVREQHVIYRSQVFAGEKVDLYMTLYKEGARIYCRQELSRQGIIAIDTLLEIVMVNTDGRVIRIPPGFIEKIEACREFLHNPIQNNYQSFS